MKIWFIACVSLWSNKLKKKKRSEISERMRVSLIVVELAGNKIGSCYYSICAQQRIFRMNSRLFIQNYTKFTQTLAHDRSSRLTHTNVLFPNPNWMAIQYRRMLDVWLYTENSCGKYPNSRNYSSIFLIKRQTFATLPCVIKAIHSFGAFLNPSHVLGVTSQICWLSIIDTLYRLEHNKMIS